MRRRAIIVHDLAQARRAIDAACRVDARLLLLSAPGAAATLGPAVFKEMIDAALKDAGAAPSAVEAVIDCGGDPGYALRAIREGCTVVRLQSAADVTARIAEIAEASGAKVFDAAVDSLDLGGSDIDDRALAAWLRPLAA